MIAARHLPASIPDTSFGHVYGFLAFAFGGMFATLACPQMAEARVAGGTATGALLVLTACLVLHEQRVRGRPLGGVVYVPDFNKTVLTQACVQASVYVFWASHEPMVRDHLPSLGYQLLFTPTLYFACCVVLGQPFRPGFWLLAVVFSTNFFLWFKYPYFWGQVLLLVAAIPAKMLLTRTVDGKRGHIFNPSGIVLSVGSLVILLFGLEHMAIGSEIVSSFYRVPRFGVFLFLVACVSQWLPKLYLIPLGAIAFLTIADIVSVRASGERLMVLTSNSSVFLGITLLITDPRTSPKTQVGRLLFGVAYGFSIALAFAMLGLAGKPSFYDKVLFVPVLNYLAPYFDRVRAPALNLPAFARTRAAAIGAYLLVFSVFYPRFAVASVGPFLLPHAGGANHDTMGEMGMKGDDQGKYSVVSDLASPLEGDPSREVRVQTVTLPPGSGNAFHRHPGDQWGVVLEGELTNTVQGQPPRNLAPGETFYAPRGTVHRNQNLSDHPVREIEILIVDKERPQTEVVRP